MPDFRRGPEEIAKAKEKKTSAFQSFVPSLFWKDNQDQKYLLFLNDIGSIPTVDMIGFIPVSRKKANGDKYKAFEQVIARTDTGIGESSDPLVEEWEASPKETCVAVAVELEPTFEIIKGRKRPKGFEVKTTTFDRRIRDDEGKLTDETEEVEAPAIGFITQSPHNFFNVVSSYDANDAPIEETPIKITRVGGSGDSNTIYTVDGYPEQDIDLSGLIECIDGISYLTEEELDELLEQSTDIDDKETALLIGATLLTKRLDELADRDRYDSLFDNVTESLAGKFGGSTKKKKSEDKKERPVRRSQRRQKTEEVEETPDPAVEEPAAEEPVETEIKEKPKRGRPAKQGDPAALSKLDDLRARAAKRKQATAASA